ncbi:hypothetical protein ITP53_40195 [Nonomuraea sp. K274]|uniref:Uncharacterized protein n=1 Tax=Nonomuraea cypriaca TaxID=1187855 RepID=A0A931AK07_9ACTN|nr:hypothetical protein [Nonomuraea cypriaca]MBF8191804.1 hypothetical protein [Nonomuraea cypriaca]
MTERAGGPVSRPADVRRPRFGGRRPSRTGRIAAGLVVPLIVLAAWQVAATAGVFTPAQLPAPSAVLAAVAELARRGELWQHVAISGQRVLLGFAAGASAGVVLGAVRWAGLRQAAAGSRVTLWPRASSLAISRWVSFSGSLRMVNAPA